IIELEEEEGRYVHQDTSINFKENSEVKRRYLINVGSVGQPRDRNPKACYAIFDTETLEFSYKRVAYNIEKAQQKMRKIRMPEFLITRLEDGR
ncbi:MAG: metallophosphatase family protein, partial [Chitinispirillaceae bacterium]|nr:metallophosphatase family protein [Chitinispirillaceae bacterium]